ncbi:hypothetical protein [Desulfoluna sp.]|uniref:hypothetical protein n=1 Tax=Desulfoluna sp. TaxID=2045199 RepID=UPI0026318D3A|nr:hypothetical protein [Desulfoluna sp.]
MTGTPVQALTPLSDEGLSATHAANGIRLTFDEVKINHTATETRYIAVEKGNPDSLGRNSNFYGSIGLGNLAMSLGVDGAMEIEAKRFAFDDQEYFVTDVWKTGEFEHVLNEDDYQLKDEKKIPQFNSEERQVVVLEALGGLANPFLTVGSVKGNLHAVYDTRDYVMGTLGITNLKLFDQRTILYSMPTIHYDTGEVYSSGEGVAMEIGMRLSIDSVKIDSDKKITLFEMKGIHLRESFDDPWLVSESDDNTYPTPQSPYDYLGKREKIGGLFSFDAADVEEMYAYSTADPDGLGGKVFDPNVSKAWGTMVPSSTVSVDNMYGGRFMIGNLRQLRFSDNIAGNKEVPKHWNHADQLTWDDSGLAWADDKQGAGLYSDSVDETDIVERPLTLSLKTRDDGSQCMALNMPLHGSIRVEEVVGHNSSGDNSYLGGNSMGPLIVEGLRVKKLYIEFPGRNKTYALRTAVGENLIDIDEIDNPWHDYIYTPGRLPVAQTIPDGQKDYNPMGRGVEEYMNRLSPKLVIPPSCADADKSGWDQYRTRIAPNEYNSVGEKITLIKDNSFWQIREPYPINSDFSDYYVSGYE